MSELKKYQSVLKEYINTIVTSLQQELPNKQFKLLVNTNPLLWQIEWFDCSFQKIRFDIELWYEKTAYTLQGGCVTKDELNATYEEFFIYENTSLTELIASNKIIFKQIKNGIRESAL